MSSENTVKLNRLFIYRKILFVYNLFSLSATLSSPKCIPIFYFINCCSRVMLEEISNYFTWSINIYQLQREERKVTNIRDYLITWMPVCFMSAFAHQSSLKEHEYGFVIFS